MQQPRVQGNVATVEVPRVGFKATFTTSGATVTGYDRQPGVITLGTQRPSVADLLARGQTTQNTIRYLQEDTFTNAATTVAEGGTKPEASFDTSEVDAPVRKIAVTAKVTDEIFNDFPAIASYIDERLPLMVVMAEDAQLLTGDGNAPNLTGLLNVSGILTQAKGADPTPDAVYKAMVQIMATGFFMPDGAVFHPLDWQDVKLLRTADGMYIWGSPADAAPDRIWGLNVVITTAITQNTALVGAFKLGAQIFYRQGITVEATNTNSDDFVKNLITIRAEQREALAVYRPKAFCTVTGV
jgi:HK97 family phage major capsid protein